MDPRILRVVRPTSVTCQSALSNIRVTLQSHANRSSRPSDGHEEVTRLDQDEATRARLAPWKLPGIAQYSHMS